MNPYVSFLIRVLCAGAGGAGGGTSMPELATTVISKIRGRDDIGLGTILGSNIFIGLFIVGLAAVICPIRVEYVSVAVALAFGPASTLLPFPNRRGQIGRSRGIVLLIIYASYLALLLKR